MSYDFGNPVTVFLYLESRISGLITALSIGPICVGLLPPFYLRTFTPGTSYSIFCFFGIFKYWTVYSTQKLSMAHNNCRYMEFIVTFHFIYRTAGIICPSICCKFGAWFCSVSVLTHNNESNEGQRDESKALINPVTLNDPYRGRTAPLTSKVVFYIFIQQM